LFNSVLQSEINISPKSPNIADISNPTAIYANYQLLSYFGLSRLDIANWADGILQ